MPRPADPDFAGVVRSSFERQQAMRTFGARLVRLEPGVIEIALPYREALGQQHGFLHGGVVTAVVDSACGYAAQTLMPAGSEVLSVEFKVNFLAPARGERFLARGTVLRAGRTLSVCRGEVLAYEGDQEQLVAVMQATMMRIAADADGGPRKGRNEP